MTIMIKSAGVSTAPGLEKFRRDAVLKGDNGGVQFLFDLPSAVGWPGQDAPVDADVIPNIATTAGLMTIGDGSVDIVSGQAVAYAGGGFDFTGLTDDPAAIIGPAGSLASIHSATDDYFMVVSYVKFPASGDWNASASIAPFFCCTTSNNGYATPEDDLLTMAQASTPGISARRQTNGATAVALNITANLSKFYGNLTQVAFWRNSSGAFLRAKSASGEELASTSVGANNSGDFSAKTPQWGVPGSFNTLPSLPQHRAAHKTRLFRGWIEDLSVSGRDPVTVLDADWTRVQARKTASGNAIFV